MSFRLRLGLAAVALVFAGPIRAADWPSFRGSLANSGATSEPIRLPLTPAWSFAAGGEGVLSSAAVVQGVVYVGLRDTPGIVPRMLGVPQDAVRLAAALANRGDLLAMDARTGALRWDFNQVGGVPIGWVDSSPTVAGGRVYFTCRDGYFYCLGKDGALLWRFDTGGQDGSSPAVADGAAYFGSGYPNTDLLTLDLATRQVTSDVSTAPEGGDRPPGYSYASPAVAGDRVVFGANNGLFTCVSRSSGKVLWRFATDGTIDRFAPAIADGRVFAAAGDYDPAVRALDLETGRELWRFRSPDAQGYVSSPSVSDGRVYLAQGMDQPRLYALDAATGALAWTTPLGSATPQPFLSSPVLAGGLLFIGTGPTQPDGAGGSLEALDAGTGALRWSTATAGAVVASPAVAEGEVVVGDLSGTIYAFRSRLPGDVDDDGRITVADAILALRAAVGLASGWSDDRQAAADVDGDGRVDLTDVIQILRAAVGLPV